MQLSSLQYKTLKRYLKFHQENYHSSDLILSYWLLWLLSVVGAGLSYWLTKNADFAWLGWLCIGIIIGRVLTTIRSIRSFSMIWNLLDAIVHWERVEELVRENEPRAKN